MCADQGCPAVYALATDGIWRGLQSDMGNWFTKTFARKASTALPFCQIAVGDGEENLDNTLNDLVHPIMKKGATYGSTAKNGEDYAPGQAQMQEAVQIQKTSDTEISVAMFFTFGSEDCNDAWIKEWGLFCLELNDDEGTDDLYRRYLNRNHLVEGDWIHKTSTIRLRVVVQIELTYNSPTPWP